MKSFAAAVLAMCLAVPGAEAAPQPKQDYHDCSADCEPYPQCAEAVHDSEPYTMAGPDGCHNYSPSGLPGIPQVPPSPAHCIDDPMGPRWVEMNCGATGCFVNGILRCNGTEFDGVTQFCPIKHGDYPAATADTGPTGNGFVLCDYPGVQDDEGAVCGVPGEPILHWHH